VKPTNKTHGATKIADATAKIFRTLQEKQNPIEN